MIDIQFNERIKITSDEISWIISYPSNPKKSKKEKIEVKWKQKYFYSSLDNLIDDLVESELRRSDAKSLKELSDDLKDLKRLCSERLGTLK